MRPSHSQLENLRSIASQGSKSFAERFAAPLVRNGWAQEVGNTLYACTCTVYITLILTDSGKQLVESKRGCCSKCKCTHFVLSVEANHISKSRCECRHYQWRHGVA